MYLISTKSYKDIYQEKKIKEVAHFFYGGLLT